MSTAVAERVVTPPRFRIGRAMRHRNYRLFFFGQGTSLIGTWLTRFAIGYETYSLTHSALQLGLVAFFSQAPTSLIAPIAGVLVDRWDRHRTLIVTQILAMLQSAALAFFALTGLMTVWHLMALGAFQAVINGFDMPARQSFVRQMVDDRADLPNAIALNSSLVNAGRLLGPVVAAALVAIVGVGGCFAVDAASYLAVIGSLLAMRVPPQPIRARGGRVLSELREGLRYVHRLPLVEALLLLLAAVSILAGGYSALLPAVAIGAFHGGAHALGALMGAAGAGALVGVLLLARRENVRGIETWIVRCGFGLGAGLIVLMAAPGVVIAVPILFVVGMSLMVMWASINTRVQTLVADDMLGRVMSLYAVAFFGGAPVGALLLGSLASLVGPVHAFALSGMGCLLCTLLFRRALPRLEARARSGERRLDPEKVGPEPLDLP